MHISIGKSMRTHFQLNPEITFLNFGSFGATPKEITEDYRKWQDMLEFEPIQFTTVKGLDYLRLSREALSSFIGCDSKDIVFTTNPSYAINIIAKSLRLERGDEILTTDLEYGAMDKTWNYYASKYGYTYKRQPIRLPLTSEEDFIEQFWKGLTPKTKAIFISQITSSTALIFPVEKICGRAKELGLITIVDGAHVPGHIDLDLKKMQADVYTGACHKWMMTPKGCSFLYVKKEMQDLFDPLLISWGYGNPQVVLSQFLDYHQQQGTRDFSAFLTVPKAIEFMKNYHWKEVSAECRKLAQSNYHRFTELLGTVPLAPVNDTFIGQMCSIEIKTTEPEILKHRLYHEHKIEIPVMVHGERVFIRYSINAFNDQEDLDRLYHVLKMLS